MKYLVLLLIVVGGIWWIRQQRASHASESNPPPANSQTIQMVPCAHCGTHVPQTDAIHGKHGVYCSEPHRQHQEG